MAEPRPSWELAERQTREAWRKLSFQQRLDWLWQAKLFANRALESARLRKSKPKGTES